jgi:hypothetical protein
MQKISIAISMLVLLATTSCAPAAQKLETERLQRVAALGYENIDFNVTRSQFLKEFRGAMKVAHADEPLGVTYFALQGAEDATDVIGFVFLNDQLMTLLFAHQESRINQLGGVDALMNGAIERFGTPTKKLENGAVWSFPTVDRKIVAVFDKGMWTQSIDRTSVIEELQATKKQLASAPSELLKPDQASTKSEVKEGWVYWQPTAAEWAEIEAEAENARKKSRVTFSLVDEELSDVPAKTQIVQHIVADGVPTRSDLEEEIQRRYQAATARRGFRYHNPATNILIYVYGTKEQAKAGQGLWLGMIAKWDNRKSDPPVVISEQRLAALSQPEEQRFDLSESERKRIFRQIAALEDRASEEAMALVPNSMVMRQIDVQDELEKKYKAELARRNQLTEDQLLEISVEGVTEGWVY